MERRARNIALFILTLLVSAGIFSTILLPYFDTYIYEKREDNEDGSGNGGSGGGDDGSGDNETQKYQITLIGATIQGTNSTQGSYKVGTELTPVADSVTPANDNDTQVSFKT